MSILSFLRLIQCSIPRACASLVCAAAMTVLADQPFDRGVLWRVEAAGKAVSHVYGTLHVDDDRVVELAPPVAKVFEDARIYVAEAIDDEAAADRYLAALYASDAQLKRLLNDDDWRKVESRLEAYRLRPVQRERIKPWAALLTLMRPPRPSGLVLDSVLLAEARNTGKRVAMLETIEQQLAAFEAIPQESVLALLKHAASNPQPFVAARRPLIAAYLDGNLAELKGYYQRAFGASEDIASHYRSFEEQVMYRRNRQMAERLQPLLEQGAAFVAVGAAHLFGERGVLAELAKRGYVVKRVQ